MKKTFLKYISRIAVFALFAGIFTSYSAWATDAENETSNMDDNLKAIVDTLRHFDFIPDYYDYNTNTEETASRADFVYAAAKLVNQTKYSGGDTYYYDVPQTFWAYNEICALTQLGILNGSDEKLFKPNDKITKGQAYKILLSLMGYKTYAESDGGFPYGYIKRANIIKLNDNVSSNELVTLADMFNLIYNAMTTNVLSVNKIAGGSAEYSVSDNETLMSIYHGINYDEGTVTGAEHITTDGKTLSENDDVEIDGSVFKSDMELFDRLGEEIKFFYTEEKSKSEKRVVWFILNNTSDVLNIKANNDASFDKTNFKLKYYNEKNNKDNEITLSRGITVIYNGGVVDSDIYKIFDLPRYEAKLVKNKNGEYSVAVVKAYENIVVDKINSEDMIVYDKIKPNKSINLDKSDYEKLSIKMLGKTDMEFKDIAPGNVLSVYMSQDNKYAEIAVNAEQASGVITEIQQKENGKNITIEGIEYFIPDSALLSDNKVGDNVVAYLDVKSEIAYLQKKSGTEFAAYLIKAVRNDDAFSNTLKIKMYTESGNMTYAETTEKLKIDGKTYDDADKELKVLNTIPVLAMIKTTTEGLIKEIDTPYLNEEYETKDSLSISVERKKDALYKSSGAIGRLSVINANTKIFVIPDESVIQTAEDTDFAIVGMNQVSNDITVDAETYKTRDRIGFEQYVILRNFTRNNYTNELPVVVDEISTVLNDKGMTVECIEGFQGKNKVSLTAKEGYSYTQNGIKPHMVVSVRRDNGGEINNCVIIYDSDNKDKYDSSGGDNGSFTFRMGYAKDLVDGVIKIGATAGSFDLAINTTNVPVVVVDRNREKNQVYVGTINEAQTYYTDENNCSMIVAFLRWASPRMLIVFK